MAGCFCLCAFIGLQYACIGTTGVVQIESSPAPASEHLRPIDCSQEAIAELEMYCNPTAAAAYWLQLFLSVGMPGSGWSSIVPRLSS